ncbi:MAG: hypothetical protein H6Q99_3723 [Proteobacteria bacterium]|nr:hypothetical protein [Pseudomonadota bacterium]
MSLYTKNGRPLQEAGYYVFSSSGVVIGQRRGDKVFGPDGHYVGTITDDRLVYRAADSLCIGAPFSTLSCTGHAAAHAARSAIPGDEPRIPD